MDELLRSILAELEQTSRFPMEKQYVQHGRTSIYDHSIQVARFSLYLAQKLPVRVDRRSLIRGALLHDYFLYDWHVPDDSHRLHGFKHPKTAWKNAKADFLLTPIEENIIRRHMFPLTLIPPACRESWIVCLADKYCALRETLFYVRRK